MNLKSKIIKDFTVYYRNEEEFNKIYEEIFTNEEYKFFSKKINPFIIDCGSHIGISILYFKSIFPEAHIIGFEPNPENFAIVKKNIKANELKNIQIFQSALSDSEQEILFYTTFNEKEPWTWGDTINYNQWGDGYTDKKIKVKAVRLSNYITRPVEFLKIDIEGAEQKVIREIENRLHLIQDLTIEYHGTKYNQTENRLDLIISILQKHYSTVNILAANLEEKVSTEYRIKTDPVIIQLQAKNSKH